MKKAFSCTAMGAVVGCILPTLAWASPVLDANYDSTSTTFIAIRYDNSDAQTFTVVNTGTLTSVAAKLQIDSSTDILVQIVNLVGGFPNGSILSSGHFTPAGNPNSYQYVVFDIPDIAVTAGEQLGLVLNNAAVFSIRWEGDLSWDLLSYPPGTYAGGQGFDTFGNGGIFGPVSVCSTTCNVPANVDLAFQTFVDVPNSVPEPLTLSIFGAGLTGAFAMRRARKS